MRFKYRFLNALADDLMDTRFRRRFFTLFDLVIVTATFAGAYAGWTWGMTLRGWPTALLLGFVCLAVGFVAGYLVFDLFYRTIRYMMKKGWFTVPEKNEDKSAA